MGVPPLKKRESCEREFGGNSLQICPETGCDRLSNGYLRFGREIPDVLLVVPERGRLKRIADLE